MERRRAANPSNPNPPAIIPNAGGSGTGADDFRPAAAARCQLINSTLAAFLFFAAVTLPNLVATVCLIRSAIYSCTQKTLQLILVWVVPLLGATVVLSVWAHDRKSASSDPVRSNEASPWLPGIGPMSDRSHPTSTFGDISTHDGLSGDGGGQN